MVSARLIHVLMVAFSLSATTQAVVIDAAADVALVNRQANSASGAVTPTPTPSPSATQVVTTPTTAPPTTAPTVPTTPTAPATTSTTTNADPITTPSTTTPVVPPTTQPTQTGGGFSPTTTPTITAPTTGPTFSAPTSAITSTDAGGVVVVTTPPPPSFTQVQTTAWLTVTMTDANGSQTVHTSAVPTVVTIPVENANSSDEAAQASNKNVIIGVCVGVGGAIVLAVAGVLYWRLRNKRRQEVDQDELQSFGTGYGPPSTAEKSEGTSNTRSPFQSTLESYHAPTQTNTASNF
ncbi:Mid2 like cell wall stress sensor [Microdochium nivale]|nr:Mid2 like cell wall stress sensor [Microdochium nivale]